MLEQLAVVKCLKMLNLSYTQGGAWMERSQGSSAPQMCDQTLLGVALRRGTCAGAYPLRPTSTCLTLHCIAAVGVAAPVGVNVTFKICYRTEHGDNMALVGEQDVLGAWKVDQAVHMVGLLSLVAK
jgi:hypothetical protein